VRFSNFVKSLARSRSSAAALTLGAACTILLAGAWAFAQTPPGAAKRIDSITLSPGQQRAVLWTQGRLRNAKPLPTPVAKATPSGTPKPAPLAPSGPRSAMASGAAKNVGQADRKTGDPNSIPLRWAGKFFFSKSDGDYICSAQFIAPHVILTAAHCMRDDTNGQWYKDFVFSLQYQRGQYTQQLTPKCYAMWNQWVHGASDDDETYWHYDYAMILTEESSKTGSFGWTYNYDPSQFPTAVKVGYPADILDGEVVQMDGGPLKAPETRPGLVMLQHGNPKNAGGSSGGAWVGDFSAGLDGNRVISVTSHHIGDETTISYGPQFDQDFKTLLDNVQGGCKNQ
jgi:hypothetical protein